MGRRNATDFIATAALELEILSGHFTKPGQANLPDQGEL